MLLLNCDKNQWWHFRPGPILMQHRGSLLLSPLNSGPDISRIDRPLGVNNTTQAPNVGQLRTRWFVWQGTSLTNSCTMHATRTALQSEHEPLPCVCHCSLMVPDDLMLDHVFVSL